MPIPLAEAEQLAAFAESKYAIADILAAVVFEQLIPLPPVPSDTHTLDACADLYDQYVAHGTNSVIPDAAFQIPKWVFLEYLVKQRALLVHGSANSHITHFEPRVAQDNLVGGEHPRVYAASSGMLAGFYAIVDRQRLDELPVIPALNNLYVAQPDKTGQLREAFQFALDYRALPYAPWHSGTVYVVTRDTFRPDHDQQQWWSEQSIMPLAQLTLRPAEWPLLGSVRGIDFIELLRRSQQGFAGVPWWGDQRMYPTHNGKQLIRYSSA